MPCIAFIKGSNVMKKSFDCIGKNRETQYPPTQREVMPIVLPIGMEPT